MEQKTIRILMTDSKSLERLWRGIRRNRKAIGNCCGHNRILHRCTTLHFWRSLPYCR